MVVEVSNENVDGIFEAVDTYVKIESQILITLPHRITKRLLVMKSLKRIPAWVVVAITLDSSSTVPSLHLHEIECFDRCSVVSGSMNHGSRHRFPKLIVFLMHIVPEFVLS